VSNGKGHDYQANPDILEINKTGQLEYLHDIQNHKITSYVIWDHNSGENTVSIKNEISDQFLMWNKALQTGDPDSVVACYAPDAILLPTVSSKVRHNNEEIRDYFVHFLTKKPHGRIIEQNIRTHDNIAINSGLYTFSLTEDGVRADVAARFTFVYQKYDDGWLIIEHHSSILPA
jgi:uncharacterized protein (TIGR02246 family)